MLRKVLLLLVGLVLCAEFTAAVLNNAVIPAETTGPRQTEIYFGSTVAPRINSAVLTVAAVSAINGTIRVTEFWYNGATYDPSDEWLTVPANISALPLPDPMLVACAATIGGGIFGSYWHIAGGALHFIRSTTYGHYETQRILNPNPTQSQFAYKLSCSSNLDVIAVYDRQLPTAPPSTSHVYIYKRVAPDQDIVYLYTTYTFDTMSGGQPLAQGVAVSGDGNVVAFGYTPGSIRVCRSDVCQTIAIPGEVPYAMGLDANGNRLAYGDITYNQSGYSGRVVVYEYVSLSNSYAIRSNLIYPFKEASVRQGYSLSFTGNKLFVGMPGGFNHTGAISAWTSYTPGRWIPMPVPFVKFGVNEAAPSLGTSIGGYHNSSFLFGGTPSSNATAPSGQIMLYTETNTWPPAVLPTLPNWQFISPPTSIGITPPPDLAPLGGNGPSTGLGVSSDGSAFVVTGQLGNLASGLFYGIVYKKEPASGYYVMDAAPLEDPRSAHIVTNYHINAACISDDSLTVAIGGRTNLYNGGYLSIYSRSSTGTNFTNVQVIDDPSQDMEDIWPSSLLCTSTLSTIIVFGSWDNGTMDVLKRNDIGNWQITYSRVISLLYHVWPVAATMSRDGTYYVTPVDTSNGTGDLIEIYRTDTNAMVQSISSVAPANSSGAPCSFAMDYYGYRLAVGYCRYAQGRGMVSVYDYSFTAGAFNTTPTNLYFNVSIGAFVGSALSFSAGGDTLAIVTPTVDYGVTFIWKAPLGSTNWVQQNVLSTFGGGGLAGGLTTNYPGVLYNFLSLSGDTLIVPSTNGVLTYTNVSTSVMPPPLVANLYTPYQTMSGYLVPNDVDNIILYGIGQGLTGTGNFLAHAYYDADTTTVKAVVFQRNSLGNYTYYADPFTVSFDGNGRMLEGSAPTVPMCISSDGQYVATALWWHAAGGRVVISWRNGTSGAYQTIDTITDSHPSSLRTFARDMKCPDDMARIIITMPSNDTANNSTLPHIRAYWRNMVVPYSNWGLYWDFVGDNNTSIGNILGLSGDGHTLAFWKPASGGIVSLNAFEGSVISELAANFSSEPPTLALSSNGRILVAGEPTYQGTNGRIVVYRSTGTSGIFDLASRVDLTPTMNSTGFGASASFCGNATSPRMIIGSSRYSTNKGTVQIRDYFNGIWFERQALVPFGYPSIITNQYLGYVDAQVVATHDCATLVATAPCPTRTCEGFAYSWNLTISAPPGPPVAPPPPMSLPVAPIAPPTQVPVTSVPQPLTEQEKWSIGIAIAGVVIIAACAITLAVCITGAQSSSGSSGNKNSSSKQSKKSKKSACIIL